jgi:alcohol dehydrogenase (cytochrome c)
MKNTRSSRSAVRGARCWLLVVALLAIPILAGGQRLWLDHAELLEPLSDTWPTYSGDYTGRRYSTLTQLNASSIKQLALAWTARVTAGPGGGGRGGGAPTIVGGLGGDAALAAGGATIKGSILQVNGVLYVTAPDNVWAVDARDGRTIWHYFWKTRGGTHIANRGVGIYGDWLYFETPDNYLVSLDARTGKERWHTVIAPFEHQYFSTPAPVIVGNHVLVGTGNDLDAPGFLQSFDPVDGKLQWKFYTVPQNPGDPGADSWGSIHAARHGGAQAWLPGSYDPETKLYYFGTGNPTPAYMTGPRGPGDHLFTGSLIAVNVDTGKMAWAYQTAPRDTHDWDSAQTPILHDGVFNGRPRKLIMTAARNGYFFVLDRLTGEHLLTSTFADVVNWATGLNARGQPIPDPKKDPQVGGVLVSMTTAGAVNWQPPSFSPQTGYFYVPVSATYAMFYLTETDPRGAMGLGGASQTPLSSAGGNYLAAIDYRTGKIAWRHVYPGITGAGGNGVLSTAGGLVFAGDLGGNIVAYSARDGKILWHARIGPVTNAPQTYMIDGRQHLLVAAGDTLFAFALMD